VRIRLVAAWLGVVAACGGGQRPPGSATPPEPALACPAGRTPARLRLVVEGAFIYGSVEPGGIEPVFRFCGQRLPARTAAGAVVCARADGALDGPALAWDRRGRPLVRGTCANGAATGIWRFYDGGRLSLRVTYDEGGRATEVWTEPR